MAALTVLAVLGSAACSDRGGGVVGTERTPVAATTGAYTRVVGDDWKGYTSKAQLQAADYFWWFPNHEQMFGNVYGYVDLVPDPVFGQVVRVTQPQQSSGTDGATPRLRKPLPAPLDRMWYRWRMRFSPGWTSAGPLPSGAANSYKVAFWTWAQHDGRGEIEYSNTNQYIPGWNVQDRATGAYLRYTETQLPGSQDFGSATSEWTDGEWYEFVAYYEKTGATTATQRWWRRRLTNGGQVADNPWIFSGISLSGAVTPQVTAVELGGNKNKTTPQAQSIFWGPWEVVDGSRYPNPFGMPNVAGSTPAPAPAPTLTGVTLTPDTVSVAAGGTVQFQSTGRFSDGTTAPVAVTYSATGGTITTNGQYTAGAAAGTFAVVAQAQGASYADTSVVRVLASSAPTLTGVSVSPGSATVQAGGTVQFQASGSFSDGSTGAVPVVWSATGGSVTSGGLYTAGSAAGTFRVIAQSSTHADTATVTVTAPPPPPPPPPPPATGTYTRIVGDDWRGYVDVTSLRAARYFSWRDTRDVYGYLALVPDATFGQVVRVTQPSGTDASPVLTRTLPAPAAKVWYRFRIRFAPGWSTSGAGGFGLAEWRWSDFNGAGSLGYSGRDYLLGLYARTRSTNEYARYTESPLTAAAGFGSAATEWTDGEWYEFVVLYEKTGATTARQHYWRRRLTGGAWTYYGLALSGATTPSVGSVVLGGSWQRPATVTRELFLGPWEVVDGTQYPNPWAMPNL